MAVIGHPVCFQGVLCLLHGIIRRIHSVKREMAQGLLQLKVVGHSRAIGCRTIVVRMACRRAPGKRPSDRGTGSGGARGGEVDRHGGMDLMKPAVICRPSARH